MEHTKQCVVCSKVAELKCKVCRVRYCSKDCQKVDWKEHDHKKVCTDKYEERVIKECCNLFEETKYTAFCYWKEKSNPFVIISKEKIKLLKESAQDCVKTLYENPLEIDKHIEKRVKKLDEMKNRLSISAKKRKKHNLTEEEGLEWWLNVIILLELKIIENNYINGIIEIYN